MPLPRPSPTPRTPPILDELCKADSKADTWEDRQPRSLETEPVVPDPTKDVSTSSSLITPSRTDTTRSSVSDIARSMIRRVPDMRMFHPTETKGNVKSVGRVSIERSKRKNDRGEQLGFAEDIANVHHQASKSKSSRVRFHADKASLPRKVAIKDRRQLARKEATSLTLPLELPGIPPRSRIPIVDSANTVLSHPYNPETPWIEDKSLQWPKQGPSTAPAAMTQNVNLTLPTMSQVDCPAQRPEQSIPETQASGVFSLGRNRWRNSRKVKYAPSREHAMSHDFQSRPLLDKSSRLEQGLKNPDLRFLSRQSCRASSSDLSETPRSERPQSAFSILRFIRPKRSSEQSLSPPPSAKRDKLYGRRKQSAVVPNLEVIHKMPLPPSFVPPGLYRVPTPPMFDAQCEVKGKLADFFFDLQGVRTHKLPASPGGVWDSDALLMSQSTDLQQSHSDSDNSPRNPVPDSPTNPPKNPYLPTTNTPIGGVYTSIAPSHDHGSLDWFRADTDNLKDSAMRGAEEIAKLEWMLPEHLPNSPLCPLHEKYQGPSKGLCVFHGVTSGLSNQAKRQTDQRDRRESRNKRHSSASGKYLRREGSALDGSEDAGRKADESRGFASTKGRTKRRWFRISQANLRSC